MLNLGTWTMQPLERNCLVWGKDVSPGLSKIWGKCSSNLLNLCLCSNFTIDHTASKWSSRNSNSASQLQVPCSFCDTMSVHSSLSSPLLLWWFPSAWDGSPLPACSPLCASPPSLTTHPLFCPPHHRATLPVLSLFQEICHGAAAAGPHA